MRDAGAAPLGPSLAELPKSALPAGAADEGGAYPFFCSSSEPKCIGQWIIDGEAIVMGTGGVASVNLGRGKFAYSTDCWAFRSRNEDLRTGYLYRVLQQRLQQIDYTGFEGSGLRHLRKEFVRHMRIDAPDPEIQRRIVDVLATVDDAIEQTEALIAKTQAVESGLMHDLFSRGVLPNGQLRPPREHAPELYKKSRYGWIPKEWDILPCWQLCTTIIDCKNRTPPVTAEGHPVIRTPNVRDGIFVWDDLVFTDSWSYAIWSARGKPLTHDLLITREAPAGEVCLIPEGLHEPCLGQRMMLCRPNPAKVSAAFMLYALETKAVQKRISVIAGGSTVGHVRVGDVRALDLPWTEPDEQNLIVPKLNCATDKLVAMKTESVKLRNIRAGLMRDLLSGRVRLSTRGARAAAAPQHDDAAPVEPATA